MLKTQSISSNYVAQVVKLDQFEAIPNANKIKIAVVNYQRVITSANAEAGTLYVYFPLECSINKDYLSWSNSFSNANLNADPAQKGFFDNNGRVRAIKLRGIMSEGYIVPIATVVDWWNSDKERVKKAPLKLSDFQTNQTFDTIGGLLLCEKYVPKVQQNREANEARCVANKKGKVKRHNKLIDNQFRFHAETAQLKRNLHKLEPNDIICISEKLHGTSCVLAHVLCKKKLRFRDKLAMKLGIKVEESYYDYLFSSRRVVKNRLEQIKGHFYDSDIYTLMGERLQSTIKSGISLYGEIVGYTPTGSEIQKGYDYGCAVGAMEFYVYRITSTNVDGHVIEFTYPQIQRYCNKYNLKHVPVHYYGRAKDYKIVDGHNLFIYYGGKWQEELLKLLTQQHLEKDCYICKQKVPCEGICLSIERDHPEIFKLKSEAFYQRETSLIDKGEVDMETLQETVE